ncbi:MAG: HAD family hydrolase [Acidobacteriota bacterium]
MIKAVISDMGNVILPFDVSLFLKKMAQYSFMKEREVMELPVLHDGLIKSFSKGEISSKKYYKSMKEVFKANIRFKKFRNIYCDIFSLNAEVLETLTKLKGKNKLFLLSNTDALHFNFIRKKFPDIFIFDDYILSYEAGWIKPEEEIFKLALKKSEEEPENTVFIDDMEENIKAAEALGMKTIHFDSETDLKVELDKLGISF